MCLTWQQKNTQNDLLFYREIPIHCYSLKTFPQESTKMFSLMILLIRFSQICTFELLSNDSRLFERLESVLKSSKGTERGTYVPFDKRNN